MDFNPVQIAIVIVIALLVFGPKRLPELGKSLGSGMREFKDSITGDKRDGSTDAAPRLEPARPSDESEQRASEHAVVRGTPR